MDGRIGPGDYLFYWAQYIFRSRGGFYFDAFNLPRGISHLLACAPTPFNDTLRVDALGYDDNFFVYNFRRHFYRWEEKRRHIRCSLRVLLATVYMTLKDDTIANIKCVVQTLDLPTPKCREKWDMV